MPKSSKRTKKKTNHVNAFHQKVLTQTPPHILHRQLRKTMPWIEKLDEADQQNALEELSDLTIAAAGGTMVAQTALLEATEFWQNKIVESEPDTKV